MSYSKLNYTKTSQCLPTCFEQGEWDGLRSDWCVVIDSNDIPHTARLYSGRLDGTEFNDWIGADDYEVLNVVRWAEINLH